MADSKSSPIANIKDRGPLVSAGQKNHKILYALLIIVSLAVLATLTYIFILQDETPDNIIDSETPVIGFLSSKKAFSTFQIAVGSRDGFGRYIVNKYGMTLYMFLNDSDGQSRCYGECAKNHQPLLFDAKPTSESSLSHHLGLIGRNDTQKKQLTFDKIPLYLYSKDSKYGDLGSQGLDNSWYALSPLTGPMTEKAPPT